MKLQLFLFILSIPTISSCTDKNRDITEDFTSTEQPFTKFFNELKENYENLNETVYLKGPRPHYQNKTVTIILTSTLNHDVNNITKNFTENNNHFSHSNHPTEAININLKNYITENCSYLSGKPTAVNYQILKIVFLFFSIFAGLFSLIWIILSLNFICKYFPFTSFCKKYKMKKSRIEEEVENICKRSDNDYEVGQAYV